MGQQTDHRVDGLADTTAGDTTRNNSERGWITVKRHHKYFDESSDAV